MKLQTRTNIYYIFASLIMLVFSGILVYLIITRIYYRQIDESLNTDCLIIKDEIENTDTIPDFSSVFGHQIEVALFKEPVKPGVIYTDTVIFNENQGEEISYRHLFFSSNRKTGGGYTINILKPLDELEKLVRAVYLITVFSVLILLFLLIGINYLIQKKVWRPFFHTLTLLNQFDIENPAPVQLLETNTKEFNQLNKSIESLLQKVKLDYINIKEFTENLSHEINTLLAILKSKAELLIQNENLSWDQLEPIKSIYETTSSLSKLNQGLLILAKIDNQHYNKLEKVDIQAILDQQLELFDDLIKHSNLQVTVRKNGQFFLIMNRTLAEIMISNLINNAIRHNVEMGWITIYLEESSLIIKNKGTSETIYQDWVFKRNKANYKSKGTLGLGLTIVRRITKIYNFHVQYAQNENIHTVILTFSPSSQSEITGEKLS